MMVPVAVVMPVVMVIMTMVGTGHISRLLQPDRYIQYTEIRDVGDDSGGGGGAGRGSD